MIRSFWILIFLFTTAIGYTQNLEIFESFHKSFETYDKKSLSKLLADDFVLIDENGDSVDFKKNYLDYLTGWNKVLGTKWKVTSSYEENNMVVSMEQDSDLFLDHFYGGAPPYLFHYKFRDGQITVLRYDSLPGHKKKEDLFEKRMKEFVSWVNSKHQEDLEAIFKPDEKGAATFKKLLELYLH